MVKYPIRMMIWISEDIVLKLDEYKERKNKSKSSIVRAGIELFLEREALRDSGIPDLSLPIKTREEARLKFSPNKGGD